MLIDKGPLQVCLPHFHLHSHLHWRRQRSNWLLLMCSHLDQSQ